MFIKNFCSIKHWAIIHFNVNRRPPCLIEQINDCHVDFLFDLSNALLYFCKGYISAKPISNVQPQEVFTSWVY